MFTNLGKISSEGPKSIGSHYKDQDHDGQVTVSSGIQLWTVPRTSEYRIEAVEPQGGTVRTVYQNRRKRGTNDWKL